ncbi:putative membrane protein (plasmid) [Phaeobacter piscinae]|uniref:Membrane protein n=2 Tax=Phaeobacter piscinae TaxID=1580596 RepID=A0ABN5DK57_9RHOB|nr:putative membrane protein [Phaeobacter piscinae]AUQ88371.1 putative membrane protein [Phaeobacter piscinae]AUR26254.1 putative membrane protein [Phaeobacter piscinae]
MIVRELPGAFQLFFVMQGSVVPKIIGRIIGAAILSIIIVSTDKFIWDLPEISISAMGIFGVALSLFLSFRNIAAYERWWEARKLWGTMIADIRTLGRFIGIFAKDESTREKILSCAVAFAHLHRGNLRGVSALNSASHWIGGENAAAMISFKNPADAALRSMADQFQAAISAGLISDVGQLRISEILSSLGLSQAGCERIATTPLPYVYSLLVRRTTYIYCWLLPFGLIESTNWFAPVITAVVAYVFFGFLEITHELEFPFKDVQNGLPLDAMCRTIEISVCEALEKPVPNNLSPTHYVLT